MKSCVFDLQKWQFDVVEPNVSLCIFNYLEFLKYYMI